MNINPAYRASELAYALTQAGVSVLVLAPGLKGGHEFLDMAGSLGPGQAPQLRHRVLLCVADPPPAGALPAAKAAAGALPVKHCCWQFCALARLLLNVRSLPSRLPAGYMGWQELTATGQGGSGGDGAAARLGAAMAAREAELRPEDPINIQYTSGGWVDADWAAAQAAAAAGAGLVVALWGGQAPLPRMQPSPSVRCCCCCCCPWAAGTTGFPKAATLSHRNILNNGLFISRTCAYTSADRWVGWGLLAGEDTQPCPAHAHALPCCWYPQLPCHLRHPSPGLLLAAGCASPSPCTIVSGW